MFISRVCHPEMALISCHFEYIFSSLLVAHTTLDKTEVVGWEVPSVGRLDSYRIQFGELLSYYRTLTHS